MSKKCKTCGTIKTLKDFAKNKNCLNGVTNQCKVCKNAVLRKHRDINRKRVNEQARKYREQKDPLLKERVEFKKSLAAMSIKICTKCGLMNHIDEYISNRSKCYQCRNGHPRGYYSRRDDRGVFIKIFTEEEKRVKRTKWALQWRKNNPKRYREIQKKSRDRPEYKKREAERKKERYYKGLDKDSRDKYQKSEKGKTASKKAKTKWRRNNPEKVKEKNRRQIRNLNDGYVISKIRRGTGLTHTEIRKHPELIEVKRIIIKTKRLCRTSQN